MRCLAGIRSQGTEAGEICIVPPAKNNMHKIKATRLTFRQYIGPGLKTLHGRTLEPLRDGLGIYTRFLAQMRERSLPSLYESSDGVRGRGTPATNLSRNASFQPSEKIAASNRGIKQRWLREFEQPGQLNFPLNSDMMLRARRRPRLDDRDAITARHSRRKWRWP